MLFFKKFITFIYSNYKETADYEVHSVYKILGIKLKFKDKYTSLLNKINIVQSSFKKELQSYKSPLLYDISRLLAGYQAAEYYNRNAFSEFKDAFKGKDIVLIAPGPSANFLEPIKDAVYIGVNRSFLLKDFKLNFLFAANKNSMQQSQQQMHYFDSALMTLLQTYINDYFLKWFKCKVIKISRACPHKLSFLRQKIQ